MLSIADERLLYSHVYCRYKLMWWPGAITEESGINPPFSFVPMNHTRRTESITRPDGQLALRSMQVVTPDPCSMWNEVAEWQLWLAHRSGQPDWGAEASKWEKKKGRRGVAFTPLIKERQGHRQAGLWGHIALFPSWLFIRPCWKLPELTLLLLRCGPQQVNQNG